MRHVKTHHPKEPSGVATALGDGADGAAYPRKRVKNACESCRRMKVRCRCSDRQPLPRDQCEAADCNVEEATSVHRDAESRFATPPAEDETGFDGSEAYVGDQLLTAGAHDGSAGINLEVGELNGLVMDDFPRMGK